ncbi:MAG: hypothetical protein AAF772_03365 [Acidobacteriota bacterium]
MSIVRLLVGMPCAALLLGGALLGGGAIAHADVLVTVEGEEIETDGPWTVRGRTVVFTRPNGTLSSMRLDEIDLDASEKATALALNPPEMPAEALPAAPEPPRESVLTLTDDDIGEGAAVETGMARLVSRFRAAHAQKNVAGLMGLVYWGDVPRGVRLSMENEFRNLIDREILDASVVETETDDLDVRASNQRDGEAVERAARADAPPGAPSTVPAERFRPSVQVTGKLLVRLAPTDEGLASETVSFLVGERLGVPYIATAAVR